MRVVCCSSGCCGIKHIRDFPEDPRKLVYTGKHSGHNNDQNSTEPDAYQNWNSSRENQKLRAGDYFKELVNQIQRRRPEGMITVNLVAHSDSEYCCESCNGCTREEYDLAHAQSGYDESTVNNWRPLLTELGFTETTFANSNSGNRIHHFTLIY